MGRMREGEVVADAALVQRMVAAQFPEWGGLTVEAVPAHGTDNAMFRLGDDLAVRMPRRTWAVEPVRREFEWLPRLAPQLPVPIPVPVALGRPGEGFPWPWTVCRWLDHGEHPPVGGGDDDDLMLARDLAGFVRAMRSLDPTAAPTTAWPRPLHDEAALVEANLDLVGGHGERSRDAIDAVWSDAIGAPRYEGPLVWIHGDLARGNLLVADRRLTGVLDFGVMGLGDPASDYRVAWNLLTPEGRAVFRAEVGADDATWARARGWVLLQAVAQLTFVADRVPSLAANARHVIAELAAERA